MTRPSASRMSQAQPQSPPKCGPYELLVRIGKGGMASVYLARRADDDSADPELFALKLLHPHLGRENEFVDMLMDEAKIASRLRHPNVVSTVDLGHDGERYYMVMDYVEGVALDRLLRRSPRQRDPALIVPLAIDALGGLQAAHEMADPLGRPLELVHRDVTPGNVIVGIDGRGRIADFGVAKARARITKTNPGVVKGKAGYIAPEVILGRDIDGRADVFSMGVLLWNALTGETLFDTEDLASSLTALLRADVPPPSTVGLMPPPIFDAPILGALHRDASHRHESAAEMAEALSDALTIFGGQASRERIGGWVGQTFGEQLEKRRDYASRQQQDSSWEPDQAEQISTSAMVRKDPTGRVVSAFPRALTEEDRATEQPAPARGGTLKWIVGALVALLALAGAALAGAYIATDGRAFAPPPEPSATGTASAPDDLDDALEDDGPEPEISPELFGGAPPESPGATEEGPAPDSPGETGEGDDGADEADGPTGEASEEPPAARSGRRRRRAARRGATAPAETATEGAPEGEPNADPSGEGTTEPAEPSEPTEEPTTPAAGERPERGPSTVVDEGIEYIEPPEPVETEEVVTVPAE